MTTPHYAPAHRTIFSDNQIKQFIRSLGYAKSAQDTEKAVEQAVNTLLVTGLRRLHGTDNVTHNYAHNTDGYIQVEGTSDKSGKTHNYSVLVEAKRDMDFSGSKADVAAVLAQTLHYLRTILQSGDMVPTVTVVCDVDEVFCVPTTALADYLNNDDYPWDNFSASTMKNCVPLVAALIKDTNIRPYVHDIQTGFDANRFLLSVDSLAQGVVPVRVPVDKESLVHVFERFKLEVLSTGASTLSNKNEIKLFLDVLRGSDDVYEHPKKPNTLVWGTKEVPLDTYRFEHFFNQYVTGGYTLTQVKGLTEMADTLLVETERRFSGDFWTPPNVGRQSA